MATANRGFGEITIGMPVLIPEDYVNDLAVRLSLYRRLADLETDEEIDNFAAEMRDRFGGDPFPYGVEANRATWEQMALYTHQQGIAHRRFTPEEIFPKGIETKVVI